MCSPAETIRRKTKTDVNVNVLLEPEIGLRNRAGLEWKDTIVAKARTAHGSFLVIPSQFALYSMIGTIARDCQLQIQSLTVLPLSCWPARCNAITPLATPPAGTVTA